MKTEAERKDHERLQKEQGEKERREKMRFIITAVLSGIAALAAVAGVIIQLA
jgi:hypothetical protein